MEKTIFKSLDKTISNEEFEKNSTSGVQTYISWERLIYSLHDAVGRRSNETIVGIIADEDGIVVKFK